MYKIKALARNKKHEPKDFTLSIERKDSRQTKKRKRKKVVIKKKKFI
jgi:hypothetical protein